MVNPDSRLIYFSCKKLQIDWFCFRQPTKFFFSAIELRPAGVEDLGSFQPTFAHKKTDRDARLNSKYVVCGTRQARVVSHVAT
jgi:hypothetical protein